MNNLRSLLLETKKPRLLVVGDIILDKFIWGHVDRISPEAPVQVVNVQKENSALGGAANVAHNLAAIGADVFLLGMIGEDEHGRALMTAAEKNGIQTKMILTDADRDTITKTRVIAGSQQIVRIDHEQTHAMAETFEKLAIKAIETAVQFDAIIVSDYQKGFLTDRVLKYIIDFARSKKIPCIIDPKRKDFSAYAGATLIKPNLKEAENTLGKKLTTNEDFEQAATQLLNRFQTEYVLITRGKDGMTLVSKDKCEHISSTARDVFDVTGAGDTVSAFLGYFMGTGHSANEAAHIANLAAGVSVAHMGTVTVTKDEVLREFEEMSGGAKKIVTLSEIMALLPSLRKNKKIVFTNGCFDILHVGHITLLQKSKALGDILIVGLNSDASIRRIKGEKRPIVSELERSHILAALESADYIVLFEEDTPLELIRAIKPDILVKGSDYKVEQVVGHEVVAAYGGRVELVDLVPGFSTTNIVEAILKNHS